MKCKRRLTVWKRALCRVFYITIIITLSAETVSSLGGLLLYPRASSPWRPIRQYRLGAAKRVESRIYIYNIYIYIYKCRGARGEKIKTVVDDFGQVISRVFLQSRRAPLYFIVLQRHIYYAPPASLRAIGRKTFWIKQQRSSIREPSSHYMSVLKVPVVCSYPRHLYKFTLNPQSRIMIKIVSLTHHYTRIHRIHAW